MHMPKCGGTSVSEAMYATVPITERLAVLDAVSTRRAAALSYHDADDAVLCHEDLARGEEVFGFREQVLLQHMAWDSFMIHGHVLYSERAERHFGPRYAYVTLLRDPVERMISNLRMAQRAGLADADVDAYLDGPLARRHAQVYLRYLSGKQDLSETQIAAAVATAKSRLAQFDVIGFLDDLGSFKRRYRDVFGVRLRIPVLNAAPSSASGLSEDQRARMVQMTAPDRAIFDHARQISVAHQERAA
ncbi:hypothetical protein [Celeribacter arenosi]